MPPRRRRMFERLREMGLEMQAPRPAPRVNEALDEAMAVLARQRERDRAQMIAEHDARLRRALEEEVVRRAMPRPMHVGRAEPMPDFAVMGGAGGRLEQWGGGGIRRRIVGRTGRNNRPNRKIMLQASKKESDV